MNSLYSLSLNRLVAFDALTCAAMGLLLMFAAAPLGQATDIGRTFLLMAGGLLLPAALFMGICARRGAVRPLAARLIIAGNLAWAAASFLLPAAGWITPNTLGLTLVMAQALAVLALAALEFAALRSNAPAASAG